MTRETRNVQHVEPRRPAPSRRARRVLILLAGLGGLIGRGVPAQDSQPTSARTAAPSQTAAPTLDQTRLAMGKWIETQQIISKERKDWQEGKEILTGRLDLVKQEIAGLEAKIAEARAAVAAADEKRAALTAEQDVLKSTGAQLARAAGGLEGEVRRLLKQVPQPVQTKLAPLHQRLPEDSGATRISIAERFQNVLGILGEINKANGEITVNYEVRELASGKSSEVKAVYVGLAQAYYVSAAGDAGIGRPTEEGWTWEPAKHIAGDVLKTLEILEGKHSPAFVPLPVKLQ
jgi:hypothetical protein